MAFIHWNQSQIFPISTPRNTAQHTYSVLPLSHLIPANLIASSARKSLSSSALSTIPEQNKSEQSLRFYFIATWYFVLQVFLFVHQFS